MTLPTKFQIMRRNRDEAQRRLERLDPNSEAAYRHRIEQDRRRTQEEALLDAEYARAHEEAERSGIPQSEAPAPPPRPVHRWFRPFWRTA